MQQVISVWVRDPRIQKNDFWHAYIDYEICLHVSKLLDGDVWIFTIIHRDLCDTSCVSDRQRVLH